MRIRINLNNGVKYAGYDYVVVEAESVESARLTTVRATGQAVEDQGNAFIAGYVGSTSADYDSPVEYRHHKPAEGFWYSTWVPYPAIFADTYHEDPKPVDA